MYIYTYIYIQYIYISMDISTDKSMDICMDISISMKHTSHKSMKQVCKKYEISMEYVTSYLLRICPYLFHTLNYFQYLDSCVA